jgi:hypothetical protein
MPDFYVDDLDISPSDFVDACSNREINQLIEILIEDGYISKESFLNSEGTYDDTSYTEALVKLGDSRLRLTNEEEEIIKKIANRL